jgi:hypothetical protein
MNAGTCWGRNTIGPRGRSVGKAPGSDFTLLYFNVRHHVMRCFKKKFKKWHVFHYKLILKLIFYHLKQHLLANSNKSSHCNTKYIEIGTVCMGDRKIETYTLTNIPLLCFWNGTWIVTQYMWNTLIPGIIKGQLDATDWFLLQNLLSAQHVSVTIMSIIRSSRVIQDGCCLWYMALWFTGRWSGVEL